MHSPTASLSLWAAVCALACAPSPASFVVVLRPTPPDDYAADPLPHDGFDAMEAAAQMPLPPEAMIPVYGFLASTHKRIHAEFVNGTLADFERAHGAVTDIDLGTTVELAVGSTDGRLVDVRFGRTSGFEPFDAAAMGAVLRASPLEIPPREIVGEDLEAHMSWRFHRRGTDPCAVGGASVLRGDP